MNTQRPTPRTDAHIRENVGNGTRYSDIAKFARELESEVASKHGCWMLELRRVSDLERELTEANEKLENLEACAVHSCGDHCQRPSCKTRREAKAMRAAIQEAATAFQEVLRSFDSEEPAWVTRDIPANALAALKLFLPESSCQPGE